MIDSQQIEELLKNTKLNSMSDIIQFILKQVVNIISLEPIQDLSFRISQLQKPQGLDTIMIQQVKTLIQAILQQKEDQIKRDLQRSIQCNVSIAMQHENSRRSLREIDILQIMSKQNSQKSSQIHQQKPAAISNSIQTQIDALKKQINQTRLIVQRKSDRRQINDMKIENQKQLSSKMTLHETQKILERFQRDVFGKLSQTSNSLQKLQYELKKTLMTEVTTIKKQLAQNFKMNDIREKCVKTERKIKRIDNEVSLCIKNLQDLMQISKKQSKDSFQQICSLIQNLDSKIKTSGEQINKLTIKINNQVSKSIVNGVWMAENRHNIKNSCVCWEKQFINQDCQVYKFESCKSQILVMQSGFYAIQCHIIGCERQPQLVINSITYSKMQRSNSTKFLSYKFSQIIRFPQTINKINLRLDNQNNYIGAILKISRLG